MTRPRREKDDEPAPGTLEGRAPEESEPDPQTEKRVRFERGTSMRLAEGGAGRKIPPPEDE